MTPPVDPPTPSSQEPDPLRMVTLCLLALLTVIVAALVAYLVAFVGSQRQTVECLQAGYAELNSSTSAARAAAAQDRQAQRELLLDQSGNEGDTAIARFLAELDEADRTRDANPLPVRRCT